MTIKNKVENKLRAFDKLGSSKSKDLMRVLLGEMQLKESRDGLSDKDSVAIIKKLIKSNELCIKHGFSDSESLEIECRILREFLPQEMSISQIEYLLRNHEPIRDANNKGQGMAAAKMILSDFSNYIINMKSVADTVDRVMNGELRADS